MTNTNESVGAEEAVEIVRRAGDGTAYDPEQFKQGDASSANPNERLLMALDDETEEDVKRGIEGITDADLDASMVDMNPDFESDHGDHRA
jgi:hypothetical protein